eukprot:2465972-Lingulodinium_polyedra.AAC.1
MLYHYVDAPRRFRAAEEPPAPPAANVAYADDVTTTAALDKGLTPEEVLGAAARLAASVSASCVRRGFRLNTDRGKTELLLIPTGKGSVALKQALYVQAGGQ